ncbi:uncharacterized protein LOC129298175 isoform X2 [Prosopis cineraria]|uniref:uncharacterized protein LOC129298175 isoform X2 n=1 Tax=Prosopis cineraria TaxID=364024 RepID=UPI00240F1EC9|nr:uncharacterized protein LOC129298175 isoform X2 [Prosopis cineraria]
MSNNATNPVTQPLIPMLKVKGANYDLWSLRMKTMFKSQRLWNLVENGFEDNQPGKPDKKLQRNRDNDAKALFSIQQALDDESFRLIAPATTSKKAWDILKQEFDSKVKLGTRKEEKKKEIEEETCINMVDHSDVGKHEAPKQTGAEAEKNDVKTNFENAVLIVVALIITLSYQAMLNPPSTLIKEGTEIQWACLTNRIKHGLIKDMKNCPSKLAFAFLFFNTLIFFQSIIHLIKTLRGRRAFLLGGLACLFCNNGTDNCNG